MPKQAFYLNEPLICRSAVVFASPHSGADYPDWFVQKSCLNGHSIRSSEDAFVDQVFAAVPDCGAPLLLAGAPRAFVDFNRSADELDPALIIGVRKVGYNPRVASGLGVIPRVVANGQVIHTGKLELTEAKRRIETYWVPYHRQLQKMLDETRAQFGQVLLADCHSMPHEALLGMASRIGGCPEVVLGDRFGASAHSEIVDQIEEAFVKAGLRVSRNVPFAGAYTTQHYGRPSRRQHAVQIEIDRSLYMDETRITPRADFAEFQAIMAKVIKMIAAIGNVPQRLAAE